MNIVFYSHVFLPGVGGIQTSTVQYACGLAALGHRVTVVTETPCDDPQYDRQFSFPVVRPVQNRLDWRHLLKDADVIISNGFSLKHIRAWRKSRVPFGWIHQMLLGDAKLGTSLRWFLRYRFRIFVTRFGHFNICVSQFMKDHIRNPKAVVIYNPIDPMFRPAPQRTSNGRVGYFGRMWTWKGISTLLEAVKISRDKGCDIPVDFYGDGQDKPDMQLQAQKLGLSDIVAFYPFQRGDDLLRAIQNTHFVVVPTILPEPFGLAAAEPLACGKCVVGSKGGGMGEVLGGANPVFDNGNAAQLADWMIRLMKNPALVAEYETAALERAKRFSRDVICQQYDDFLQTIVRKPRR